MRTPPVSRSGLAILLSVLLIAGMVVALRATHSEDRVHVVAYFDNTNGLFVGDEVRILGVPVGQIDAIEPQPDRAKVTFWFDRKYQAPADAKAVILSPSLVSARAIQLAPAYTTGPMLADHAVIPQTRTAVPVEWDDLRTQLEKLTHTLQPDQPGGVSTLGALINTAAANLRGQGSNIHDMLLKLSQAFSALGDHSGDLFNTVKNLSVLVSALQDSTTLMAALNENLAAVSGLIADDPDEVGGAVSALNAAAADVQTLVSDNSDALGTTGEKLASITQALNDSREDIKQTLHVAPTTFSNFMNIYQPAQGSLTGILAINNFANPISFLCGAIQAASRLNNEQSAKLCAQYLAPIIKNRQYNFPPLGENLFVGTQARPNEITYSEDRLRPDFAGPQPLAPAESSPRPDPAPVETPPPAPMATDPTQGLPGMMSPPGGGS